MDEMYIEKAPWYCDTSKTKVSHYKERKPYIDVKYCTSCGATWEVNQGGVVVYHRHLPTLGLERAECSECEQ